jgi:NADPH-dependent curcumin reductase CurA
MPSPNHQRRWLVDELGFDAAIDYKLQDVRGELRKAVAAH